MFKTNSINQWSIPAKKISVGKKLVTKGVGKFIELNPHLPFIYIPTPEWSHFGYALNQIYDTKGINCNPRDNYCKFESACHQVKNFITESLNIRINDGEDDFDMEIPLIDLLAPGTDFDDRADYCYIGVFDS